MSTACTLLGKIAFNQSISYCLWCRCAFFTCSIYQGISFLVCDNMEYHINDVRSQRQTIIISRLPQPSYTTVIIVVCVFTVCLALSLLLLNTEQFASYSTTSTTTLVYLYTYTAPTIRPGTLFPFWVTPQEWTLNVWHADLDKEPAGLPQTHLAQCW